MRLNNTPVRTCRNYNINDIEFDEEVPKKLKSFNSLKIFKETEKDEIITDFEFENFDIKYGAGLINQFSNQNIKLNINSKTDKEIKLEFEFDDDNLELLENIEIEARENTISNIYIIYKQKNLKKSFHNGLIKVLAKPNSKITVTILNLLNHDSSNILTIDGKLEENSKLKYNIVDFGGKTSITNLYTNLKGKESQNLVNTIYLGSNDEKIDLNYIAECYGEKTNINIDVQGALKDNSKKNFKGTIDFKKGCKKAYGNESENCMLLSSNSKSMSLPMLLCSEEDVEGNHSSSSGKANDKELFYIMSRGFDKKSAEKLLVRAKFNNILNGIVNQEIKNEILYEIDKILD